VYELALLCNLTSELINRARGNIMKTLWSKYILSSQLFAAVIVLASGLSVWTALLSVATADEPTAASLQHAGPAVWIEEYWEVKPERFDDFVRAYRSEVYSITRRIEGYRGYTFLTNLQDEQGVPRTGKDQMISDHYGIHLQGKVLTEQVVDLGQLLRRTHNVIIIHHLQDWSDARSFRRSMEELYAKEHGGSNLWDHLSETVFVLANNSWETSFRMIETGLDIPPARPGKDADGLDLEPRPSSTGWFKEYFDVLPEDMEQFLDVYRNNTLAVMKPLSGYEGVSFVTTLPPGEAEAARSKYRGDTLGGPDGFFVSQPGVMMGGTVRTDTAINYSSLFHNTFTMITYYQLPWNVPMMEGMQMNYDKEHPGEDRLKHITKVFFPLAQNHWDMWYRAIETSFVPLQK
jgi:hypothetical protein